MNMIVYKHINRRNEILQNNPELEKIFDEHLEDYDEILPNVLFGEIARFFVNDYMNEKIYTKNLVKLVENFYLEGDKEIKEIILFGFLENLLYDGIELSEVKQIFSQELYSQLSKIKKFWDSEVLNSRK